MITNKLAEDIKDQIVDNLIYLLFIIILYKYILYYYIINNNHI